MNNLTSAMKKALKQVGYGVRRRRAGNYYSIDDNEPVSIGSLDALYRRGLIDWRGVGGSTHQIHLSLTVAGERVFEELNNNVTALI